AGSRRLGRSPPRGRLRALCQPRAGGCAAVRGSCRDGPQSRRRGCARHRCPAFGEALSLWRGAAYADFQDTLFGATEAARLEEMRLAALEARIDADLALGRHAEVTAELEALVHECPLRERFWCQLMLALYRSGRQSDALLAFRRARGSLTEEIGVEPGPELCALEAAILAHDPGLSAPDA